MKMKYNILSLSLSALRIRHSRAYTTKFYAEYPERGNLLGVALMLQEYGVNTEGVRFDSPDQFAQLKIPFIAQRKEKFVVVKKKTYNYIVFQEEGSRHQHTLSERLFYDNCSGVALTIEAGVTSEEPNYRIHRRSDIINAGIRIAAGISVLILLCFGYFRNRTFIGLPEIIMFIFIDALGVWLCALLIQQQLGRFNVIGESICNKVSKNGCKILLKSKVAYVFGKISWAELGLGYFSANLLLITINTGWESIVTMLNIMILPFTLLSIWYQKYKIRHWCTLCLLVMAVLWVRAFTFLTFTFNEWLHPISFDDWLKVGCVYVLSIYFSHYYISFLSVSVELTSIKYTLNKYKADLSVFEAIMEKQPRFQISDNDSHIIFGKHDAPINLTVISNPHCFPCAKIHNQIRLLMKKFPIVNVRYIFTAFNSQLLSSNRYLIASYLEAGEKAIILFDEWFESGSSNPKKFWKEHPVKWVGLRVEKEILAHLAWTRNNRMSKTPAVLLNGVLIPEIFTISDLSFLLQVDGETRKSKTE
jgi:hypothetical protein